MSTVKIVSLAACRAARKRKGAGGAGMARQLPDSEKLWELLDRNISITVWKENGE